MKLKDKKVIIFDLDGTLIDSAPDLAMALNRMLESLGRKGFDEVTIRGWIGNGATTLVKRALSGQREVDDSIDNRVFEEALSIFFDFYEKNLAVHTITYPNVIRTLKILRNRNYRLVIITNKPFVFVAPILNSLGIMEFFEYFIGGDSLPEKKPSPQPLLHICDKFNISIDESVMIGDSKNDILSANASHMQSIAVTYGYNYEEYIGIHNPTIVIDNFEKLVEIL